MKKKIIAAVFISSIVGAIPALAEVDPKIHKLCIEAKDYAGCVRAMEGETNKTESPPENAERCWGDGLQRHCLAKEGIDNLGMPKLVNWLYSYDANGSIQYDEADVDKINKLNKRAVKFYFIPHKGKRRYYAKKSVRRNLIQAKPGYSGSSFTFGSASTQCNTYGSQTYCSTTPATTVRTPGRASQPARVHASQALVVYDCEDKTYGVYFEERKSTKWRKDPNPWACSDIPWDEYETLHFKL